MKKLIVLIGFLFVSNVFAFSASENICSAKATMKGGEDYWPWGNELKFPWAKITGVWSASDNDCRSLFIFRPGKTNSRGEKLMEIIEYDPNSCIVISRGVGIEVNKVIKAAMVGRRSYDLAIRAFSEADLDTPYWLDPREPYQSKQINKQVIVMHLYPKNRWVDRVGYPIVKLNNKPEMMCRL